MKATRGALPALVVTLLGVLFAWLAIAVGWWAPVAGLLLGMAAGWAAYRRGERRLPDAPEVAVRWMEWWVLVPGAAAAVAQAFVIWLGVMVELWKVASIEIRQLRTAALTAISTFLIVTFVRGAEEADEGWVGRKVQAAFRRTLDVHWHFPPGSDGEKAVHSDGWRGLTGWGREARRGRAREVAGTLARREGS